MLEVSTGVRGGEAGARVGGVWMRNGVVVLAGGCTVDLTLNIDDPPHPYLKIERERLSVGSAVAEHLEMRLRVEPWSEERAHRRRRHRAHVHQQDDVHKRQIDLQQVHLCRVLWIRSGTPPLGPPSALPSVGPS